MDNCLYFGKIGEQIAVDYLKMHGYTIVERNWVSGKYEVDIICTKDDFIIFVEVKSHQNNKLFDIRRLVDKEKQKKLSYCANNYVRNKRIFLDVRFDIIVVNNSNVEQHIVDAFYCILGK